MTLVTCPACNASFDHDVVNGELLPPELDDQGFPIAASVQKGFGLPIVPPLNWGVTLDGAAVKRCIAFDRRAGLIWHYPEGPDGKPIRCGEQLRIEKLTGFVAIQPLNRADT